VQKTIRIAALCGMCFLAVVSSGQSTSEDSLCSLQQKVAEGERLAVRVAGVFSEGLDMGILSDAACSETTWVELALENKRNRKKLGAVLDRSRHSEALVVFEGELYGPPTPDPKLREAIRRAYHPWWGHLNCCRTKLVVRKILEVKDAETMEKAGMGAASRRDDRQ